MAELALAERKETEVKDLLVTFILDETGYTCLAQGMRGYSGCSGHSGVSGYSAYNFFSDADKKKLEGGAI